MTDKNIDKIRNKINEVDNKILELLDQRSHLVLEIGKFKDKKLGIIDNNREQEILDRLINETHGLYSKNSIIRIWRELFEASSKLQEQSLSAISPKRSIENIDVYTGGNATISGNTNIIKLSSNESAFGPSKKIKSLSEIKTLNRYPEISGVTLREEIARIHNLNKEQIILGCGSDETLLFAALAFCQSGDEIIHAEHGFEMYPIITKVVGAVSKLATEENYKISVQSICDQITDATKVIYIANPNNPTGTYLNNKEILDLLSKIAPHIIVVLDGAYAEYVMQEDFDVGFSLVKAHENVILTRTFSKVYGLAGIRLGWCYTSLKVASIISRVKGPFNTNTLAQNMAMIALRDQVHIKMVVEENKKNKSWFEMELQKLGIKTLPTFTNFSFIESTQAEAAKIAEKLLENGIIVRQLHSYKLSHCLRISIGTLQEMKATILALRDLQ